MVDTKDLIDEGPNCSPYYYCEIYVLIGLLWLWAIQFIPYWHERLHNIELHFGLPVTSYWNPVEVQLKSYWNWAVFLLFMYMRVVESRHYLFICLMERFALRLAAFQALIDSWAWSFIWFPCLSLSFFFCPGFLFPLTSQSADLHPVINSDRKKGRENYCWHWFFMDVHRSDNLTQH